MKIPKINIEQIVTFPTRTSVLAGGIIYESGRILRARDLKKIGIKTMIYSSVINNYIKSYFPREDDKNY